MGLKWVSDGGPTTRHCLDVYDKSRCNDLAGGRAPLWASESRSEKCHPPPPACLSVWMNFPPLSGGGGGRRTDGDGGAYRIVHTKETTGTTTMISDGPRFDFQLKAISIKLKCLSAARPPTLLRWQLALCARAWGGFNLAEWSPGKKSSSPS